MRTLGRHLLVVACASALAACGSSESLHQDGTGGAAGGGRGGVSGGGGQAGNAGTGAQTGGAGASGGQAGSSSGGGRGGAGGSAGAIAAGGVSGGGGVAGGSAGSAGHGGATPTGGTAAGGQTGGGGAAGGGTTGGAGTTGSGGITGSGGATGDGGVTGSGGVTGGAGTTGSGGMAGSGGAAGGAGMAGSGGAAGSPAAHCGAAQILVDSSDTLIDLFIVDAGVIVVDTSTVSLIGRDAQVIKSVPFARQITAAAFDGTHLVIADEAEITVMSPALDLGPSALLTESCASAVLLGENHFVCGPATDWERVFYTYDVGANPPAQIAVSASSYTYQGTAMRRVPGTDDFITVENYFSLFAAAAGTGVVAEQSASPFVSSTVTSLFAFDGTPPTHLIQGAGDILTIAPADCAPSTTTQTCFTQTGMLGTLRSGEGYVGLGDDGAGRIVALVSEPTNNTFGQPPCLDGCTVQDIDIASRTILQQQSTTISDLAVVVRTLYDPGCGAAVIGYSKGSSTIFNTPTGYRVQAFSF